MKVAFVVIVGAWLMLVIAMIWFVLTGRPGLGGICLAVALMIAAALWLRTYLR